MSSTLDRRQVRHTFSRFAHQYSAVSSIQKDVQMRLLDSLTLFPNFSPNMIVDVGAGTADACLHLRKQWPKAIIVAIDQALPMLLQAKKVGWWQKPIQRLVGNAQALPMSDQSVDLLFCNLCLQWIDDLPSTFREFRRVLRPGGLLLCSTFGEQTLCELRQAFMAADEHPHVMNFQSMMQFGNALVAAGFQQSVIDREEMQHTYRDFNQLLRTIRSMGATNAMHARRKGLTGRQRFSVAAKAYENYRNNDGHVFATWEIIYGQAIAPPAGVALRSQQGDYVAIAVEQIPIRRNGLHSKK